MSDPNNYQRDHRGGRGYYNNHSLHHGRNQQGWQRGGGRNQGRGYHSEQYAQHTNPAWGQHFPQGNHYGPPSLQPPQHDPQQGARSFNQPRSLSFKEQRRLAREEKEREQQKKQRVEEPEEEDLLEPMDRRSASVQELNEMAADPQTPVLKQLKALVLFDYDMLLEEPLIKNHYTGDFVEKMAQAVKDAKEHLAERVPPDEWERPPWDPDDYSRLEPFVDALPYCLPLRLGFHLIDGKEHCCCPLSSKLKPWHEKFALGIEKEDYCPTTKKFDPHPLMSHLRARPGKGENSEIYHSVTERFLTSLYQNYFKPGLNHKALYDVNSKEYKRAEFFEQQTEFQKFLAAEKRAEQKEIRERTLEEQLKALSISAKDMAKSLKQKEEMVAGLLERIGCSLKPDEEEISQVDKDHFYRLHKAVPHGWRELFKKKCAEREHKYLEVIDEKILQCVHMKDTHTQDQITQDKEDFLRAIRGISSEGGVRIVVKEGFSLQRVFDQMYQQDCPHELMEDLSFDFDEKDTPEETANTRENIVRMTKSCRWLKEWSVNFKGTVAKDKGGPTRVFLTEVWKGIGDLKVSTERMQRRGSGTTRRPETLFTQNPLLAPREDDVLEQVFSEAARERAIAYYRAFGRILLYALINLEKVASHVLANVYRNYLIRGITPKDKEYPVFELVHDVVALKLGLDKAKDIDPTDSQSILQSNRVKTVFESELDQMDKNMTEEGLREYFYEICIGRYSIGLGAIREGLTLERDSPLRGGAIDMSLLFLKMPMSLIEQLVFAKANFEAEDILKSLVTVSVPLERTETTISFQSQILSIEEKSGEDRMVTGKLADMIRDHRNDQAWLRRFVFLITGMGYMPHPEMSDFKIVVEFNEEETDKNSLPQAHSCVNVLKFPYAAYDGNGTTFDQKMEQFFEFADKGGFQME